MSAMNMPTERLHQPKARTGGVLAIALATGLALVACAADPGPPVSGEGAEAVGEGVDLQVLSYLINNDLPGATVAATRAGRLVWSKGYGYADLDDQTAMQPWHRSRIGSVSKILTTIGALQLAEDGRLDLDMPLYGDPGPFHDKNTPWPPPDRSDWAWPFETVLETPQMYWAAMRDGAEDLYPANHLHRELNQTRDWASQATVTHVLSHTSGLLRSGHGDQVDAYYGKEVRDYRDAHLAILRGVIEEPENAESALTCFLDGSLYVPKTIDGKPNPAYTGKKHRLPPYGFAPGTGRCYSNHGFGLMGHIIGEASDGPMFHAVQGYREFIKAGTLDPLGLNGVVPNNTALHQGLDAWPHGGELDPDDPAWFTSTGSWSASAQDLTRIMCGLDRASNHLRLLRPETVTTMETVHFPDADPNQPLGWDWRVNAGNGSDLYKNGRTTGGTSIIMKFLPGRFGEAPHDEINVAFAFNAQLDDDAVQAATPLIRDIAQKIARADIPDDYDLFDPAYRCVVEGPTVTILAPSDGMSFALGTEIFFEAEAYDAAGNALPISWSIPQGGDRVSQPSPSDGRHSVFFDGLSQGQHTIVATAVDSGGYEASQQITLEITYEKPDVWIVSHADGDTVRAGDALHLAGQSTTGGHFTLTDSQLSWAVRRDGVLVREGTGPHLTVPDSVMQPGSYIITFTGHDGQTSSQDEITIVAEPPPAEAPTIFLRRPLAGSVHVVDGNDATIDFVGAARDFEGTTIDGTYFRWTATRNGETTVLCEGSDIGGPPPGAGGFVAKKSCGSFTAQLRGYHVGGHTSYRIVLEVQDTFGNIDEKRVNITVFVPPAG